MKNYKFLRKLTAFILIFCTCLPLVSCMGGERAETTDGSSCLGDTEYIDTSEVPEETETPVETFDLIADGKSLYTIVRPDNASSVNVRAAVMINNHIKNNGAESYITDWGDKTGEEREILVGDTKFFPDEAIADIDLTKLGTAGFVIKAYGNKILIAANNDQALVDAAGYFIENFLDIAGGKTTMPKDYCYISSNGLFLSELTFGGHPISDYTFSCDERVEEQMHWLRDLIKGKAPTTWGNGSRFVNLVLDPSVGNMISAKFENGNLVIRAKDVESMKKAIVCFWYENIAYSTGSYDLPANLDYSRDLTQTIFYSDFDVVQSDSVCCREKLYEVHAYANEKGYKVFADYGAKYYIASVGRSVIIDTDVEWGNAEFTIDDSQVTPDKRGNWIFTLLENVNEIYQIDTIKTLDRKMTNLGVTFPQSSIVTFYDDKSTHYIRYGGNADNGQTKRDSVVVDKNGNIDMDAPLMWDFDNITSISVLPIEEDTRTISGGVFTTIANRAPSEYTYYARGLKVNRSNTVVNGVTHYITGEGATGAPYNGFLSINNCAYVTVKNCVFTGHKTYQSPTTAMGSYDIAMANAISVSFINCSQANDINNSKYWGVSGTNYCKNFVYDGCVLSRFDAHKGVANAAIKNSVIGHAGASIIGYGTFLIENSTFMTNKIVNLRSDYGSSWEGDIIIRNCIVAPTASNSDITLITGSNKGNHNFGYPCYMPTNVIIDGLIADTSGMLYVFANLNSNCTSENYVPSYPFYATEKVTAKNVSTTSKRGLQLSKNTYLCANTEFINE